MPSACIGTESDGEDMETSLAKFAAQSQALGAEAPAALQRSGLATTLTTSTPVVADARGGSRSVDLKPEEERREEEEEEEEEEEDEEEDEEEKDEAEQGESQQARPSPMSPPAAHPTEKIVFLDIDGVLNTRPDPRILHVEGGPCALLRRLLESTGAKLVLTTPWRRHSRYVTEVLGKFDVFPGGEVPEDLDRTPLNADPTRRDLEILHWLRARRGTVKAWVALDSVDLLQFPSAMHLEGHVVQVSGESGLGPNDLERCREILGPGLGPGLGLREAGRNREGTRSENDNGGGGGAAAAAAAAANLANWAKPPKMKITLAHTPPPWDVKSSLQWDDALASKMEDLLQALAPKSTYRMPGNPILLPALRAAPAAAAAATAAAAAATPDKVAAPSSADSAKITRHQTAAGVETVEVTFDGGMGGGVFRTKAATAGDSANVTPVVSLAEQRRRAERQQQQQQQQQQQAQQEQPQQLCSQGHAVASHMASTTSFSDAFRSATTWDDALVKGMEDLLKLLPPSGSTSDRGSQPSATTMAMATARATATSGTGAATAASSGPRTPQTVSEGSEFDALAELARSKFAPANR